MIYFQSADAYRDPWAFPLDEIVSWKVERDVHESEADVAKSNVSIVHTKYLVFRLIDYFTDSVPR